MDRKTKLARFLAYFPFSFGYMNSKQVSFLVALLIMPLASEGVEKNSSAPFSVADSGAWVDGTGVPDIFWIDNERIIFRGSDETEKRKQPQGRFNTSVWRINGNVSVYRRNVSRITGLFGRLCYSEGTIFYPLTALNQAGESQYAYGLFGSEKISPISKGTRTVLDKMNCRLYERDDLVSKRKGRAIRQLLDRHGYLDLGPLRGPSRNKGSVLFYRSGQTKGIELPIPVRQIGTISYYTFKNAYLIQGDRHGKQFWWLYPDGKVEEVSLPVERDPYPTREGMVTQWGAGKSYKDPGTAGLYLWKDNQPVKLIGGFAHGVTVSPDGCKVAFAHYPYSDATLINDPAPITLKAIDLCHEEKTNGQ